EGNFCERDVGPVPAAAERVLPERLERSFRRGGLGESAPGVPEGVREGLRLECRLLGARDQDAPGIEEQIARRLRLDAREALRSLPANCLANASQLRQVERIGIRRSDLRDWRHRGLLESPDALPWRVVPPGLERREVRNDEVRPGSGLVRMARKADDERN